MKEQPTEATQPGSPDRLYGAAKKRLATFESMLEDIMAATQLAIAAAERLVGKQPSNTTYADGLMWLEVLSWELRQLDAAAPNSALATTLAALRVMTRDQLRAWGRGHGIFVGHPQQTYLLRTCEAYAKEQLRDGGTS